MAKTLKKTRMSPLICIIVVFALFHSSISLANSINIELYELEETRTTNESRSRVDVRLNINGEIIDQAKGLLSVNITNAYCDNNIEKQLKSLDNDFEGNWLFSYKEIDHESALKKTIYLSLPERSNKYINIYGELLLYTPKPTSVIKINNFHSNTKVKVKNKILELSNIGIMFFTKYEYNDFVNESKDIIKDAISNNKNTHNELLKHYNEDIVNLIESHNISPLGFNEIYFIISNNWKNIVNIELQNKNGRTFNNFSKNMSHGDHKVILGLDYNCQLSSIENVIINIIQDGDMKTIPFQIKTKLP